MSTQTALVPLALVVGLALAGCAGSTRADGGSTTSPPTASPAASPTAAPSGHGPDEEPGTVTASTAPAAPPAPEAPAAPAAPPAPPAPEVPAEAVGEPPSAPAPEPTQLPIPGAIPYQNFTYDQAYAAWQAGMPYYDAFCLNYEPTTPGGVSQCEGIENGTVDSVTGEYIGG